MDKIKNLVNPGSKKDDEVMYGSGTSDDPVHSGTAGAQSGQGSHLASSNTPRNNLPSSDHSTANTSGVGNTTGKEPLSTSTNPTGNSQYDTTTSAHDTHGLNEPHASRMPGGFDDDDAATTASIRSGVPGQTTHTGSGMTGTHEPSFNKPLPEEPAGAGAGVGNTDPSGTHATGGSNLTGNSYADRSAGSSGPGNSSTGTSHIGRDAAIGAGTVGTGAAAHHHRENAQRDNYAPETGRSFPLGGNSNTVTESNLPSGQARADAAGGSTTAGPHSSNLANKADPRVDSDLDGSRSTRQTGYGSGSSATPGLTHQGLSERETAVGAGSGATAGAPGSGLASHGPESWQHEHGRHGHQYEGDPCGPGETRTEGPHFISGPHSTDTANRLDPHVAGGTGGTESVTSHHDEHNHRAKDAALAGGAAGAGLGTHSDNRHHPDTTSDTTTDAGPVSSGPTTGSPTTGPAPTTAGPHKSDMMNKLDPRVDSDLSKQRGNTAAPATGLESSTEKTSDPYPSQGTKHHHGAEAAVGGAGLAGAAAHQGDKHNRQNEPNFTDATSGTHSSTSPYSASTVDPRVESGQSSLDNTTASGSGKDHHLGRDAGLGAGAGGLAHETGHHHDQSSQSTHLPSGTTGGVHDTSRGPSDYVQPESRLAGSGQQPAASRDHHPGRDAALGAGAGGALYEAEKRQGKDHSGVASTPQDQLAGSGHQHQALGSNVAHPQNARRDDHLGRDTAVGGTALGTGAGDPVAGHPSSDYSNQRDAPSSDRHAHRKEEEALAGGAAAGGLAHHEHSKKDEKALEKEHAKEVKQHDKALAKEEKAMEKDQKAHEKERAKHMAAIEKDQKKHEHDGEKKKGGLLGFLHRDKPDKEHKEEEAQRKTALRSDDEETSAGAGAGSASDALAGEHGSQSGVHDSPIGKGNTTHEAYRTQEGHNKLHKDPPGTVAARGAEYQGHGNIS
ncbi:hypothetical protein ACLMJK_002378 [Lecanora helva]